jgi:hypothetical protein
MTFCPALSSGSTLLRLTANEDTALGGIPIRAFEAVRPAAPSTGPRVLRRRWQGLAHSSHPARDEVDQGTSLGNARLFS